MLKNLLLASALLAILLGPIVLRRRENRPVIAGERELIVISPHNEAIREEFARAFVANHRARTGENVRIDWRTPGGTSEIARYLASEYQAAFQYHWERSLGRKWSDEVERAFDDPKIVPAASADQDSAEQRVRRAFLDSKVGCGIDLFFGGGAFDFAQQAAAGRLVDCGFVREHPELFNDRMVPRVLGGEQLWDPGGRWIGVCLSAFGICWNTDSLARLGIPNAPHRWEDLSDVRLFHQVALANPTQSGSVNRAFELLVQQQMLTEWQNRKASGGAPGPEGEAAAVHAGWENAMRLLMKISANSRYFTDSANKVSLDVATGEAAAGMTIDFYGRIESDAVRRTDGSSRLQFANASGGTSFGGDPIGLFRGAPHPGLAKEFIAWTLSEEGQKLWNWKAGAPDGPVRYALRRLPILPAIYTLENQRFRSDPEVNPYLTAADFTYHGSWTGPLFKPIGFIVRVMCIDPHEELAEAWSALIDAHFPPEATQAFGNVEAVKYEIARNRIGKILGAGKIAEVQLAKELADAFRTQYRRTAELARKGK